MKLSRQNCSIGDAPEAVIDRSDSRTRKLARQLDFVTDFQSKLKLPLLHLPPRPPLYAAKPESSSMHSHHLELKHGTLKKQTGCSCKHSKCIKLYCDCFAAGTYCDGCGCTNCQNNVENEATREAAIKSTLDRNPNAFRRKIAGSSDKTKDAEDEGQDAVMDEKHKGCNCKRSRCLKKYCECFQANIICSERCKCVDCKNFHGSEEVEALHNGRNADSVACIQQTNSAIDAAIKFSGYRSSEEGKKKCEAKKEDSLICRIRQSQQDDSSPPLGSSTFAYRSSLAGAIQPQDTRELCSVLVLVSEAAKVLAGENGPVNVHNVQENQAASSFGTESSDNCRKEPEDHEAMPNGNLSWNQVDITGEDDQISGDADSQTERPPSPGTLALMCDEKDTFSLPDASSDRILNHGCKTDVYAKQERLVLGKFWDCLNKLITRGSIIAAEASQLARDKSMDQRESLGNHV